MAPPTSLTSERVGIVAPELRDRPWRETVRVSWDRLPVTVALGRASGAVVARYDVPGSTQAVCLQEVRAAGDRRPLIPVPDGAEGTPGFARSAMVDAAAEIPIGSGGRRCGYAVAVQDVFGVWSRWEDVGYVGSEPRPPRPRVLALRVDTQYAGSSNVPAGLQVELSADWAERTPARLELQVVFYRMAAASDLPPPGAVVVGPPPPGGFRRDVVLPFTGDRLTGPSDVGIEHLGELVEPGGTYDVLVAPGPAQGTQGRRYRVRVPVTLDFGATRWWGVRVWVRSALAVGPSPSDCRRTPRARPPPRRRARSRRSRSRRRWCRGCRWGARPTPKGARMRAWPGRSPRAATCAPWCSGRCRRPRFVGQRATRCARRTGRPPASGCSRCSRRGRG
jgi:hypothetical protein